VKQDTHFVSMKFPANFDIEEQLWNSGARFVAGVDEVGRGSWAGPVVAAAVVFPPFFKPPWQLYDSKALTVKERETLSTEIQKVASIGIGEIAVPVINRLGIGKASQQAFRLAIRNLKLTPDFYLIDAFYIRHFKKDKQLPIKKGDQIVATIAAASIVAKVFRDHLMVGLDKKYPKFGFALHKGYGTKLHQEALREHHLSVAHRKSFNLTAFL